MGREIGKRHVRCAACGAGITAESERQSVRCNVHEFRDQSFTIWRCEECRCLHCLEDVDLARYYRDYPFKRHQLDFWTRLAYRQLLRRLRKAGFRKDQSLLDYGCGPGLFVRFLRNKDYRAASGYDAYVPEFFAKETLDRRYDVVFSQDVIEHVESPKDFMHEIARLVKPGGVAYIGTPNAAKIDLDDPESFLGEIHAPYHRHILSESALVSLARDSGLELVARYPRYYLDTPWPSANTRVIMEYLRRCGNWIDAAFEPPRWGLVLRSPALWYYGLFGYFHTPPGQMALVFRSPAS